MRTNRLSYSTSDPQTTTRGKNFNSVQRWCGDESEFRGMDENLWKLMRRSLRERFVNFLNDRTVNSFPVFIPESTAERRTSSSAVHNIQSSLLLCSSNIIHSWFKHLQGDSGLIWIRAQNRKRRPDLLTRTLRVYSPWHSPGWTVFSLDRLSRCLWINIQHNITRESCTIPVVLHFPPPIVDNAMRIVSRTPTLACN